MISKQCRFNSKQALDLFVLISTGIKITQVDPKIQSTSNYSYTVNNHSIKQDFYIDSDGNVMSRSDEVKFAGSSPNVISLKEASTLYDPNANEFIIGSRVDDKMQLTDESTDFFEEKRCKIKMLPLDEAIEYWNRYNGHAMGLFHITK